jgi:hypothetical protein
MASTTLPDLALRLLDAVRVGAPDTVLFVEVVAYDPDAQTADVRLCVQVPEVDPDTGEISGLIAPVLRGRPVMWPSGGGMSLVWGLAQGDIAQGVIRSRSHDEVDSGSAVPVTPASTRRGNLSDLVVVPLVGGGASPLAAAAYRSDGQPVLVPGGAGDALHVGASTAAKALALAEESAARIARIENFLNSATYAVSGPVTTAPSPPPFTGAPVVTPVCIASVVAAPAAATTTAALASTRIKVDT